MMQHHQHPQQQRRSDGAGTGRCSLARRVVGYCRRQYLELPANVFEAIALVLVVFVQDVAFKESIVICAGLLTASFVLHGLAFRARQCQVFPKVVELAAPIPFFALLAPAYLATAPTQKAMFIVLNFWFFAVELLFLWRGVNFMEEYYRDWNPPEMWGSPLLRRCSGAAAATWMVCQAIMGLAQVCVVAFDLTLDTNLPAAVLMCYVMQLLPLLWAIAFTFAYPAWLRRRWSSLVPRAPHHHRLSEGGDGQLQRQQAAAAGGGGGKDAAADGHGGCSSCSGGGPSGASASSLASTDACIQICSSSSGELGAKAAVADAADAGGGDTAAATVAAAATATATAAAAAKAPP